MIEVREAKIHNGNIANMEQYKAVVGERTGLLLAINEIEDLRKNQEAIDNAE
tara:strand:+ start:7941 stop:8096 length:156 start_codon:yes stop_codon:yes gene_type:complete